MQNVLFHISMTVIKYDSRWKFPPLYLGEVAHRWLHFHFKLLNAGSLTCLYPEKILCDHSYSLCRWELVILGLAYCHARSPPVLPESKPDFFSFSFLKELLFNLEELNGMSKSPLETKEENQWWLLPRTGSYAICFSGSSSSSHIYAFLSWSSWTLPQISRYQ